jgi:hypothetical protein
MNRKSSSIRTAIGRGGRAGVVLAMAVAGVSAAVLPASASPAAAHGGAISFWTFTGSRASLSGGGHKWGIIVDVEGSGVSTPAMSFGITTAHLGGTEEHAWGTALSDSQATVGSSGAMTMNTGTDLGSIGSVKAYFTPTGHKTESADCASGSEVVYSGKFTGAMELNTGLKGLKLAGHLAGTGSMTFLDSCILAPCSWSSWDSSTNGTGAFANGETFSYPGKPTITDLEITNVTTLSAKKDIIRIDSFFVPRAPNPIFSKSAKSLTVTSGKAGLITGAATLKNGHPMKYIPAGGTCKFNGQTYSLSGTEYSKAAYDASKPFEAHTILNGVIKIKPSGKAEFAIVTVKKK